MHARQAWGTAAQVRSSSVSAAFDEVALSLRFTVCTSLFCASMTLLCLGAFGTSFYPQQDAARWLSRAIWVGWLCTWGFGIFGLTIFICSDAFVTSFCAAASCSISRQTLRMGTTCVSVCCHLSDEWYTDLGASCSRSSSPSGWYATLA